MKKAIFLLFLLLASLAFLVWPASAQESNFAWKTKLKDRVTGAALSADGKTAVFSSRSGEVIVVAGNDITSRWQAPNAANAIALTANGSKMAVVGDNQQLTMLDSSSNILWQAQLRGAGISVGLSADGNRVAAGTWDSFLQIFDGQGTSLSEQRLDDRVYGLDYSSDAAFLVSGTRRGSLSLWNEMGDSIWAQVVSTPIRSVSISGDGKLIIAGSEGGQMILIDKVGNVLTEMGLAKVPVRGIALDEQGGLRVAAVDDGQIFVIDASGKTLLNQTLCSQLFSAALSANGEYAAVGCEDGTAGIIALKPAQQSANASSQASLLLILGITGGILLLAVGAIAISSRTARGKAWGNQVARLPHLVWRHRTAYLLIIPSLLLVVCFSYYPAFSAIIHAFTNWSPGISTEFVGLANFQKAFSDPYLWTGVGNLLILLVVDALKVSCVPLLVAELVFNLRSTRARYLYRMLFSLPMVVPGMVGILLWQMIYNPEIGLINQILQAVGLSSWARPWLADSNTALASIIFMGFPWVGTIAFLIYYAGLIDIPEEIFDASRMDGATNLRRFWHIDLPLIAPQIRLMILFAYIGRMQGFQDILVMTGGGPGSATYVPALEMYFSAFRFGNFGYASSIATMLFLVILVGTILVRRQPRSGADQRRTI